jgi:hypothetical protein
MGPYGTNLTQRAQAAAQKLYEISQKLNLPETSMMIGVARFATLKVDNETQLTSLANSMAKVTKDFAAKYDGSTLGAIDSLIPGPDQYKGKPAQ